MDSSRPRVVANPATGQAHPGIVAELTGLFAGLDSQQTAGRFDLVTCYGFPGGTPSRADSGRR